MGSGRLPIIFIAACSVLLVGVASGETQYVNTPAVSASAVPYGGTTVTDEAEFPESPLLVEAASEAGNNTAWAQAAPGRLRVSSSISNAPESYHNSQGIAMFADHYRLDNPAMPPNSRGTFFYRFYLTGTMRIKADDIFSLALVNFAGYTIVGDDLAGQLNFGRIDGVPTLYAQDGGTMNPVDNILTPPGVSRRVYGSTTTPVGDYYVIQVGLPVTFVFHNMPINTTPPVDDWQNLIDFRISAVSMSDAQCDFSSTFEFADQNPIVPDPEDPTLPVTGWTMDTASGEIVLVQPLTVATSTGSGEAAFLAPEGTINNLQALTLNDFPAGLTGGNFAHGWFGMDVALMENTSRVDLAMAMPAAVGTDATWWYHDGAEWQSIALENADADSRLEMRVNDNGPGDGDPAWGAIAIAGGLSDAEPTPAMLSVFTAEWQTGGVDLSWQAQGVPYGSLQLEAHLNGTSWLVPLVADGSGGYSAHDDAPALFGGGTVRYDLKYEGVVLDSRTVELPTLKTASLGAIAPNPFNPRVEIAYTVAGDPGHLELTIHDLLGRRVTTLVSGDPGPGRHLTAWTGLDATGQAVPSGTYLVRLATQQRVESKKIMLVR
jgi:hypothetical protein